MRQQVDKDTLQYLTEEWLSSVLSTSIEYEFNLIS